MAALSLPQDSYQWHLGSKEEKVIFWICIALIGQFAFAAALLLSGVQAPYGRYNQASEKNSKGFMIRLMASCDVPAKVAWVLQECPTLVAACVCWMSGSPQSTQSMGNNLILLCFVVHYINRTIVYPLRTQGSKPIPLPVMLMALAFCAVNGYIQCRSVTQFLVIDLFAWTTLPGVIVWAAGLCINMQADRILRELRKPGESGYKIPYGGAFEYVSGANFFGEIVEWLGFAIAMGLALPGVTFAFCTVCNIGPRAVAHHKWYLEKFNDEYPKTRKALIPFIF